MNDRLRLDGLRSETFFKWIAEARSSRITRLAIVTSGYEKRSSYWSAEVIQRLTKDRLEMMVIGFEDFPNDHSRRDNDRFYKDNECEMMAVSSLDTNLFNSAVRAAAEEFIKRNSDSPVEIHIDYSCMPRRWYCNAPAIVENIARAEDRIYFWYSPGEYPRTEYPSAGVEDFKIFSGTPSLCAITRTHIFGLGFDRIRSKAIWSVLDPQNLICFYAKPGTKPEYVERVINDNEDLIRESKGLFAVPIDNFVFAFSAIREMVREYRDIGDVIIVPDGPKPLILASSIIPLSVEDNSGIVCFHVSRRNLKEFKPVEVYPYGEPFGFSFCGRHLMPLGKG